MLSRAAPMIKISLYVDDCAIMRIIVRTGLHFQPRSMWKSDGAAGGPLHNYADRHPR